MTALVTANDTVSLQVHVARERIQYVCRPLGGWKRTANPTLRKASSLPSIYSRNVRRDWRQTQAFIIRQHGYSYR